MDLRALKVILLMKFFALYNEGKCGMWIDATIAASF
ncbi:MAG: hypothetical protein CM15mP85_17990 [Rhodobacterales bacterium]|nr:MAG: hypothetical protein CM15mP85_17990 [Rhodobacterales bacterium]